MRFFCDGQSDQTPTSASQMQAYASRTVDFLNVIEKAVSRLATDRQVVVALACDCEKVIHELRRNPPTEVMDEEGRVCDLLKQAAAITHRQYQELIEMRNAARVNTKLRTDDGVVDGFEQLVAAFAQFHNVIEDLRETIEALDALKSPVLPGAFTSVDDLFAAMNAH